MASSVNSDGPVVMWSIGQIAERDGVTKAAVSKMVTKLVRDHELPVRLDGRGRVAGVSVADYDHHRRFFGSSAQDQTSPETDPLRPPASEMPPSESRDEALRQKAWMEVRRQKLEDAKEAGRLVRADHLADALQAAGKLIQSEVGRIANSADDIALAVSKEGTSGARLVLRKLAEEVNGRISKALASVAATAPERDDQLEDMDE